MDVRVRVEGDITIVPPGRTLVDIARLLPADEVTIEHQAVKSVVHVSSGGAKLHAADVLSPRSVARRRHSRLGCAA